MFLTCLGCDSRAVITRDITQVDLPSDRLSGLVRVPSILKDIKGVGFVYLTGKDVVKYKLIQEIVKAYGRGNT